MGRPGHFQAQRIGPTVDVPAKMSSHPFQRVLLRRSLAVRERFTIPFTDQLETSWAIPSPDSALPRSTGVEGTIAGIFEDLSFLLKASLVSSGDFTADVRAQHAKAVDQLAGYNPSDLAVVARHWHGRASAVAEEISKKLALLEPVPMFDPASEIKCIHEEMELSAEQHDVINCEQSVFVQGRSGTGKTMVLLHRMLLPSRRGSQQLFVTKSSLLLDKVMEDLRTAGCDSDLTTCRTWSQLVGSTSTVNYKLFLSRYWPDLKKRLAAHLPAHLAWAEFCTKLRPFTSFGRTLSLEEYSKDGCSAVGVPLTRQDQKSLYETFAEYQRLKAKNNDTDDVDVASSCRLPGVAPDYIYIDEAQDFSPWELTVLLRVCPRPDGVTVAGDTCQTINPGSAFNFEDIMDASGRRDSCHMFSLKCNYRCSPSVASLSNSVVKLLLSRFPQCADAIEEVTLGKDQGATSLMLESCGASASDIIIGTGAARVPDVDPLNAAIIVRNDEARNTLRSDGVRGPILTVAEAKGLEYKWVVLYNMLTDGEAFRKKTLWMLAKETSKESKVVREVMATVLGRRSGGKQDLIPSQSLFTELVLLVPELKNIYVAITRAQVGCILVEDKVDPAVWMPLRDLWSSEGSVECWTGMQEYISHLHEPSGAAVESREMPPISSLLNHRFPIAGATSRSVDLSFDLSFDIARARNLQTKAENLLAHAADDPRERWRLFAEAQQSFFEIDAVLARCIPKALPGYSEVASMHSFACELCRKASWRRWPAARHLRNIRLLYLIFTFLVPQDGTDSYNRLALIVEQAAEIMVLRGQLTQRALLSKAWHIASATKHDEEQLGRETSLRRDLRAVVDELHFLPPGSSRGPLLRSSAAAHAAELYQLLVDRAGASGLAGRMFRALHLPLLAADCFAAAAAAREDTAAVAARVDRLLAEGCHIAVPGLLEDTQTDHVDASDCLCVAFADRVQSQRPASLRRSLSAALRRLRRQGTREEPQSSLHPTSSTAEARLTQTSAQTCDLQELLRQIEYHLARANCHFPAASVSCKLGKLEDAMRHATRSDSEPSLVWLIAAQMGEKPWRFWNVPHSQGHA